MRCLNPFDEQQGFESDLNYCCNRCNRWLHGGNIIRCSSCESVECFECSSQVNCILCRQSLPEVLAICRHCDDAVVCDECTNYLKNDRVTAECSECSGLLLTRRERCKFCSSNTCCHSSCLKNPIVGDCETAYEHDCYYDCCHNSDEHSETDEKGVFSKCYGCAKTFCVKHMLNVCRKCHSRQCDRCAVVIKNLPRTCGCPHKAHCAKPEEFFAMVLTPAEEEEEGWCDEMDYQCRTLICENCYAQDKLCFFEWNKEWHDKLCDIGLILLSGGLPPYVVLEILDFLPHVQYLPHGEKIKMLISLQTAIRNNTSESNSEKRPAK